MCFSKWVNVSEFVQWLTTQRAAFLLVFGFLLFCTLNANRKTWSPREGWKQTESSSVLHGKKTLLSPEPLIYNRFSTCWPAIVLTLGTQLRNIFPTKALFTECSTVKSYLTIGSKDPSPCHFQNIEAASSWEKLFALQGVLITFGLEKSPNFNILKLTSQFLDPTLDT